MQNLCATYTLVQLIKILASVLPMGRTNLFYFVLKHCKILGVILISYLYNVEVQSTLKYVND